MVMTTMRTYVAQTSFLTVKSETLRYGLVEPPKGGGAGGHDVVCTRPINTGPLHSSRRRRALFEV